MAEDNIKNISQLNITDKDGNPHQYQIRDTVTYTALQNLNATINYTLKVEQLSSSGTDYKFIYHKGSDTTT